CASLIILLSSQSQELCEKTVCGHTEKMKLRPVFWMTCLLIVVLSLLVACNRDGASPAVSKGGEMKAGPIVYVALGDSTGSVVGARNGGYVARLFTRLLEHRAGSELVNLCVSGATTNDVWRGQLQSGVQRSPDLVTLGIGIN